MPFPLCALAIPAQRRRAATLDSFRKPGPDAGRRRMPALAPALAPALVALCALSLAGCFGSEQSAGELVGPPREPSELSRMAERQALSERQLAAPVNAPTGVKQVLFGDLHVHSSYSLDAMAATLPYAGLTTSHPPADACDFARYCARVDFFSLTDHAESLTAQHWQASKDMLRRCDARAGDAEDKDLVVFAGWEWTQIGLTADQHWGHRNVIFPGLADSELPARPINANATGVGMGTFSLFGPLSSLKWVDPLHWKRYADFQWLFDELSATPQCAQGTPSPQLSLDCAENAPTPEALYRKLDEWGLDSLVIPHGSAWGLYTPPRSTWDQALAVGQYHPGRQRLIEIMSGHGNSEEYRPWQAQQSSERQQICPAASADYLPCCQRAGQIMRERCGKLPSAECERRVELARQYAVGAGLSYWKVFPDAGATSWLNCGQCEDCFKPAYNYVPRSSVQHAMAQSNFQALGSDGQPLRFRMGFIAASDNHAARPGTGYKQYRRREMSSASGARSRFYGWLISERETMDDPQMPQQFLEGSSLVTTETGRLASYLFPGGVTAVHSAGRNRQAVWQALKRREAYGTSGPRILLWFDLLNGAEGRQPMGSAAALRRNPRFEVRAAGDFLQRPGCPEQSVAALGARRVDTLCGNECYYPGERRQLINAIEVVRIRPQIEPGEPVDGLIEDVWRRFDCPPDPNGCVVQFEDDAFVDSRRGALYYVRALQAPTPAINGAGLRAERRADGSVAQIDPCWGDYRTAADDNCLAPAQERAWSSPIFIDAAAR